MGMADKDSVEVGKVAFGQMVNLTTIEQQEPPGRPNPDQQQRIVEQASVEDWFYVTKREKATHRLLR
jgi:hypothetical protein